jgi:hypothetical protein
MKGISIFLAALCLSLSFTNAQERIEPKSKAQIDYLNGIKVISNPNQPKFGERSFKFTDKKIINEKFNYVKVDLDRNYNLFVLDLIQKKIFKFSKEGIHQQTIECNKFIEPENLFIDSDNSKIYVSDRKTLHVFESNGAYSDSIKFPCFIQDFAITKKQKIIINTSYYKLDNVVWEISLFDLEGNHIRKIFEHSKSNPNRSWNYSRYHPKLLFRHNKEVGVYGFSGNYDLYLINQDGETSLIIKKIEPASILTAKERNEIRSMDKSALIPKYKAFFIDIILDDKGNIYVEKWKNKSVTFDFFNKEGFYLYRIKAPLNPIFKIFDQQIYCGEFIKNSSFIKVIAYNFKLIE